MPHPCSTVASLRASAQDEPWSAAARLGRGQASCRSFASLMSLRELGTSTLTLSNDFALCDSAHTTNKHIATCPDSMFRKVPQQTTLHCSGVSNTSETLLPKYGNLLYNTACMHVSSHPQGFPLHFTEGRLHELRGSITIDARSYNVYKHRSLAVSIQGNLQAERSSKVHLACA
jgi:hypothetical protein